MEEKLLESLSRKDSLDLIQEYVLEHVNKKSDVSSEMFKLFFNVIELGKEVRISLQENETKNSKSKIVDIFLVLISICNSMNINLFDALIEKEKINN
jgi:NTP pyrophosphatase (non-canonical NTP hydrolase)